MAIALLQFTQGLTTGNPGEALVGVIGDAVVAANSDDTGVDDWTFELAEVPPGSAVPLTAQGPGGLSTLSFTPDVPGCYRIRLTVTPTEDGSVDIRNFVVRHPRRGHILPPFQALPEPLPLPGSGLAGSKPNELNIGGQAFGWVGDDDVSRPLLFQQLRLLDSVAVPLSNEVWVDSATTAPAALRNGSQDLPFATMTQAVAALPDGGVVRLGSGNYSGEPAIDLLGDYTFLGSGNALTVLADLNYVDVGTLRLQGVSIGNIAGAADLIADNLVCTSSLVCNTITAVDSKIPPSFAVLVGDANLDRCDIGNGIELGGTVLNVRRSRFLTTAEITFDTDAGTVTLDEYSLHSYVERQVFITNGVGSITRFDSAVLTSYSPTITGLAVGSTGSKSSKYRIVGDVCHTWHAFLFNGAGTSLTTPFIPLPLGLLVDNAKLTTLVQTLALTAGSNGGGPQSMGNVLATYSGGAPTGLTLDNNFPSDFLLSLPSRLIITLDMPFKIP
jgi:hypothetical protein